MSVHNHWDTFFEEKIKTICRKNKTVIDIGGGLRIDETKNNRKEHSRDWTMPFIKDTGTEYKILDKVADYHPDIVGDIHELPFEDNSIDAIVCIAILEHVENPIKATEEMYRVLKPGGMCFIYVPFLFYYHPMKGYYKDFYRFTYDGLEYMTREFKTVEFCNVRGAVSTAMNLFPFFSKRTALFDWIDRKIGKHKSKQTSGYNVFCIK
ncbi:MAG: hypothetical protein COU30_05225 [Candidatus Magasanikbacteria bacterium CG10_big_fil_rev_8_21_14_0_10_38_6]|uniref:Methyltransferase type 11 domain-containing protein n=1 Tax=Candidatus Magasanikbacteria bacterium CG10_big_fil_rev_8_21_14_0_10_38_6 TaxID=1974647 RepID=A0A2M6P054_9BACT|nr:MAG: hypothetical protein COU30_05225 [Candidatus Magasanikbacteria bacterium CG10_big_fil_rev_8_21_14_0_10_38_6]